MNLYRELKTRGFNLTVILPEVAMFAEADSEILQDTIIVNLKRKGLNPLNEILCIYEIAKKVRLVRPDVLHNFTIKAVLYGTVAGRLCKVPRIVNSITGMGFIFTSQSILARLLKPLIKLLYRVTLSSPSVRVIFQNPDDLSYFVQQGLVQTSQCHLILGSGVDTHTFKPQTVETNAIHILCVARLLKEKGIRELVEATKILNKETLPPFEVQIAGDLDQDNPGSFTASDLSVWSQIPHLRLLGQRNDIKRLLNNANIFCLPSYREGLPMATLEAMACGLPIITTNVPGCRETVRNNENGYLIPAMDPNALAEALKKLIQNSEFRTNMGTKSRVLVEQEFSKDVICKKILSTYFD